MSTRFDESFDETETRVRDALRMQAGRAPHPAAVLDALHHGRPRAAHRGRGTALILAAAAVVVVAAVGIPLGLHLTARPGAQTAGAPSVTTPSVTTAPTPPGTSLRYAPTWLPSGVVEYQRLAAADGTVSRTWLGSGSPTPPMVELVVTKPTGAYANVAQQIAQAPHRTVHGVTAGIFADNAPGQRSRLVWLPDAGTVIRLTVSGIPNSMAAVEQVADSIGPDSTATVSSPVAVGSQPGLPDTSYSVHGTSPGAWVVDYNALNNADHSQNSRTTTVSYGPGLTAPPAGGTPVDVNGKPGTYYPAPSGHQEVPSSPMLAVRLGQYWLEVFGAGNEPEATLLQVAKTVTTPQFPTPTWIGTR